MSFDHTTETFPDGSILHAVGTAGLAALDTLWSVATYDKGQMILQEEDANSDIWFMLTGTARVAVFTESGREVSVVPLQRGDCFGEFGAIDGQPRSASIEAVTDCRTANLTAEAFRSVREGTPEVSEAFLRLLVSRLRNMNSKVSDFSAHTADERIRAEILRIAEEAERGSDSFTVQVPPTQSEIAARVFTNRETVAREMGRMRRKGLIGRDGRKIVINSLEQLRDFVEDEVRY